MCLAQGHNAVTTVWLEPAAPRVEHSTTESLRSLATIIIIKTEYRECSGSVVECLTRDRRAAGSSLTAITALCT